MTVTESMRVRVRTRVRVTLREKVIKRMRVRVSGMVSVRLWWRVKVGEGREAAKE